ncbi:hypothetical protein BBJ28_00006141 [Nothophytophthora sp. Chile5]|nr:hypothetical protein BBJ28_00006141 [Nothophytophthora sp. Chile5]
MARQLSPALLGKTIAGIWHTGVLVFGQEYFFGGGIQVMAPELVEARYGMHPVEQIALGETQVSQARFEQFLRDNSSRFTAATYDLLRHNCNNFSNEVAAFLNMQREMNAVPGAQPFAIPFNDPSRGVAAGASSDFSSNSSSSAAVVALASRKFKISGTPTLHLNKILARIESLNSQTDGSGSALLSEVEVSALQALPEHVAAPSSESNAEAPERTLQWWQVVSKLLAPDHTSPYFFPALGVFRVLLLLPSTPEAAAEKDACFEAVLQVTEAEPSSLASAHKILLLSVLLNAFANPGVREMALSRSMRFLPFVFAIVADPSAHQQSRVLSAHLISNCCLALKIEEEVVITTIVCGAVETLDIISRLQPATRSSQTQQQTIEGIIVGLGRLLGSFAGARSLSLELGLAEVLRRLHVTPGNQSEETELSTPEIVERATATIKASFDVKEAQKIWKALGLHLEHQLRQGKTVKIANFGVLGTSETAEPVFQQDSVFLHSTRLCLASRKRGNRSQPALSSQSEPEIDINMAEISVEYAPTCSQELVRSVIVNIIAWVLKWAKDGRKLRLSFLPLGEWVCDGESVDFNFQAEFRRDLVLQAAKEAARQDVGNPSNRSNNHQDEDCGYAVDMAAPIASSSTAATSVKQEVQDPADDNAGAFTPPPKRTKAKQNGQAGCSRYELRAPTFASIARQRPPITQRRGGTTAVNKAPIGGYKTKPVASNRRVSTPTPSPSSPPSPAISNGDVDISREKVRPGTINRIRARLSNRRGHSIRGLNALASIFCTPSSDAILPREIDLALRKLGVKVSAAELRVLAQTFSHRKRGFVNSVKLLGALRGPPLSAGRLDLIARAFHRMDPMCRGVISIDDLRNHYDVSILASVCDGTQSKQEALTAFLQEWQLSGTSSGGVISFETFVAYYHDADFELLMRQAWHVSLDEASALNDETTTDGPTVPDSSHEGVATPPSPSNPLSPESGSPPLVTSVSPPQAPMKATGVDTPSDDSAQSWTYLRTLLLFPQSGQGGGSRPPTLDDMCRRLGANRILGDGNETMNGKAFAHALTLLDKRLLPKKALGLSQLVASGCAEALGGDDSIALVRLYRIIVDNRNGLPPSTGFVTAELTDGSDVVASQTFKTIERIRSRVLGPRNGDGKAQLEPVIGLSALETSIQGSTAHGDAFLSKQELRLGLRKVGLDISFLELDYLFAYFDADRRGYIPCEAFLEAVRGTSKPLPPMRKPRSEQAIDTEHHTNRLNAGAADLHQSLSTAAPCITRRKQRPVTKGQGRIFHRRNLIHRAIWDQSGRLAVFTGVLDSPKGGDQAAGNGDTQRSRRNHAAQLIQARFRGFRSRQIATSLRRKAEAQRQHRVMLARDQGQAAPQRVPISKGDSLASLSFWVNRSPQSVHRAMRSGVGVGASAIIKQERWKTAEVQRLLEMRFQSSPEAQQFAAARCRRDKQLAWEHVSQRLRAELPLPSGDARSPAQCEQKLKNLRKEFLVRT